MAKPPRKIPIKRTVYGTGTHPDPPWFQEYQPKPRICAKCGQVRPEEWYELMDEGWVCDPCNPKPKINKTTLSNSG